MAGRRVTLPPDRIPEVIGLMRQFASEGSGAEEVRSRVNAETARQRLIVGEAPEPLAVLKALFGTLKRELPYSPDPANQELVRDVVATFEDGRGDCEDLSIVLGACAKQLGYRAAFVVLSKEQTDGPALALHVFPVVEVGPDNWMPFDLALALEPGEEPNVDGATRADSFELEAGFGLPGLGSILDVLGGVFNFLGAKSAAKSNEKVSQTNAEALRYQSDRAYEETELSVRAAGELGKLSALTEAYRTAAGERTLSRALDFGRELLPVLALIAALQNVPPVIAAAIGKIPTQRRATAPRARERMAA